MLASVWTHRDIVEDAFDFADLMDINHLLDIKAENERRHHEWLEQQRANAEAMRRR